MGGNAVTIAPPLDDLDLARFVARGFLRFDNAVPDEINRQFLKEAGSAAEPVPGRKVLRALGDLLAANEIPEVAPGTLLSAAYPTSSATRRMLDLPMWDLS